MTNTPNSVRIISGKWRGRKIHFPNAKDLRPTGDRIRETLFNWLAPNIHHSRCLDLYAGSGVLGFEAASRGATSVTMVDCADKVVRQLYQTCDLLQADNIDIYQQKLPEFLSNKPEKPYDIVFLDPPFNTPLLTPCCQALHEHGWLSEDALIYLEMPKQAGEICLPEQWQQLKSKSAGQVSYQLYTT